MPANPSRRVTLRAVLVSALVALFAVASLVAAPQSAHASQLDGVITDVRTTKEHYAWNERLTLAFAWRVPDGARAGDTFRLDLPDELAAASLAYFTLDSAEGTPIATARWEGKTVVFTLTDFVEKHDEVAGEGFLTARWDHSVVVDTTDPIVLEFGGTAIEVTMGPRPVPAPPCTENCPPPKPPAPPATSRTLAKGGSWADGAYEGTRDETGNISWAIALPGNPDGYDAPVTVVDEVGPGSVIECSTIAVTTQQGLASGAVRTAIDPARITLDCDALGFTLELDRIAPNEFVRITYRGTISQQGLGVYTNSVVVEIAGTTTERTTTMRRTSAGGTGSGVRTVSVGDLVWLDADHDGRQSEGERGIPGVVLVLTGPEGENVVDIDGRAVSPVTTDDEGMYRFGRLPVLAEGESYTVSIDVDASAVALAGLLPTTPSVGDRGGDSSTASASSSELLVNGASDLSLDFGFVMPQLPTLPEGGDGDGEGAETDPDDTPAEAVDAPPAQLATTGPSSLSAVLALSSALLALGAALLGLVAWRLRGPRFRRRGDR